MLYLLQTPEQSVLTCNSHAASSQVRSWKKKTKPNNPPPPKTEECIALWTNRHHQMLELMLYNLKICTQNKLLQPSWCLLHTDSSVSSRNYLTQGTSGWSDDNNNHNSSTVYKMLTTTDNIYMIAFCFWSDSRFQEGFSLFRISFISNTLWHYIMLFW